MTPKVITVFGQDYPVSNWTGAIEGLHVTPTKGVHVNAMRYIRLKEGEVSFDCVSKPRPLSGSTFILPDGRKFKIDLVVGSKYRARVIV